MDVIDIFLETFLTYIDSGFGLLAGDVAYLTTTLIAIDITLAGLFWALGQNTDVIAALIKKVLYVGAFAFIIGNFAILADVIFESFAALGLTAGGSTMTADDLLRPGFIAQVGYDAATPLLDEVSDLLGPVSFFYNFIMIAVLFLAWTIIMAAFFVLAVQLFVTILEFKLMTLAGFILVPFALWNKTTFLAERVLGNVVTSGIKLMVLAVIIGIGSTLFASITDAFQTDADVTLAQVMGTVLAATVFLWMGVFSPGIASGLVTGAPQLGAGSLAGAGLGVAASGYAAGMGVRAIGSASGEAMKAGASLAGGARTAYALGSAASGHSGAAAAGTGLIGVAKAGGDLAKSVAGAPVSPLKRAYESGQAKAWQVTGGDGGSDAAQTPANSKPHWANRMEGRQAVGQAGQIVTHTLRDGDRGGSGATPSLKDGEES